MSDQPRSNFAGIGLSGALFLLFTYLKLTDQIDWSWGWVTSPLWIPLGLLVLIGIPVILFMAARTR